MQCRGHLCGGSDRYLEHAKQLLSTALMYVGSVVLSVGEGGTEREKKKNSASDTVSYLMSARETNFEHKDCHLFFSSLERK